MKLYIFFSLIIFIISPLMGEEALTPRQIAKHNLNSLGDFFPSDLFPVAQTELNLTNEQMRIIEKLKTSEIEARQVNSHNFPESMPVSPAVENKIFDVEAEAKKELSNAFSEDKLNDFCQWVTEQSGFEEIRDFREGNTKSDIATKVNQIFDTFINSKYYQEYKKEKSLDLNSKTASDYFFFQHEKVMKLRILFEFAYSGVVFNQLMRNYIPQKMLSTHIDLAKKYYISNQYEKAIGEYKNAIEDNPLDFEAFGFMGYSYLKIQDFKSALEALQTSVKLNNLYIMGHYNLVLAYWDNHNLKMAFNELAKVIELDPTFQKIIENDPQFKSILVSDSYKNWVSKPYSFYITPEDPEWWQNRLMLSGFADCFNNQHPNKFPFELTNGFMKELALTKIEFDNISELQTLAFQAKETMRD